MVGTAATTTVQADPEVARRAWPRWLALGGALLVVAVVSAFWDAGGARLLLGALGLFGAVRGAVLVAGAGSDGLDRRVRGLGAGTAAAGVVALAAAAVPGTLAGWVLLVGTPLGLLAASLRLVSRDGVARRGGLVALVWSVLVTALLVVTGLATDWDRARDGATLVAALGVGVLGIVLMTGSAGLRVAAARPAPPAQAAGCAGCACSGGGCGALG
ncbi:hypothetical protein [Trujillonella endophytica]|uniref:DUF308 domain-containing protein n=1 Tax=Trujillonella endophytica TaxID=673521 RepID=A0A1H8VK51_9ACTN|nr:hypothetical protein [Trujillella endophytica]SEP15749.1 hypothetical protein SAMN05660991_03620 [Trujillella endophytica]